MLDDVQAIADFYRTARGQVVARLLRSHLAALWPDLSGQTLLGLGFSSPFLGLWRHQALVCIDGVTSTAGATVGADCLLHDDLLPFPTLSVGRILMAHALENATNAQSMLRTAWRVLRDDGRLLIVVPNRNGLWAHSESPPFADGAPYSTGRIARMLARSLFRIERLQGALYCPPADLRPLRHFGPAMEAAGRFVTPKLAGVLVVEAVKDVYAALPAAPSKVPGRRVLMPLGGVSVGRLPVARAGLCAGLGLTASGGAFMNRPECPPSRTR